jgi:hypothetical protein
MNVGGIVGANSGGSIGVIPPQPQQQQLIIDHHHHQQQLHQTNQIAMGQVHGFIFIKKNFF